MLLIFESMKNIVFKFIEMSISQLRKNGVAWCGKNEHKLLQVGVKIFAYFEEI